ncbi:uncharacterized protein N0V89_000504 [Didymosphaeria variabile]|uniref:BTB domain-containing protein n=1 Tax=Didymosphaeria variabile TaxID=1932322 RepID=A0A9W9CFX5_9PLEO|nr:uncharacterized protein N0V89_000504 [Didymosphaeria variabile]KAJ4359945.1 hypothetical protein N0V89_000504 [Didymosphaeria variabile]
MWPFKALTEVLGLPLSYMNTIGGKLLKTNPRDLDLNLDLKLDRTMAPSPHPIIPFTMYPSESGHPIRFLVGPAQMPFDVHSDILDDWSPAFSPNLLSVKSPLGIPSMTPEHFGTLTKWLYDRVPPTFKAASDLLRICELWVAACQLGLWAQANTLMRLGMELMQPPSYICSKDTVHWVFSNTPASSPLRGYIIAIFAQRSQFVLDNTSPYDAEIYRLTASFHRNLEHARKVLDCKKAGVAWGKDRNGLFVFAPKMEKEWKEVGGLPMPEYLVWDKVGMNVPDSFFVQPGTGVYREGLAGCLKWI